jgi:hypothetical protein
MSSRMERYYQSEQKNDTLVKKRTVINKELYDNIYDDFEYSNVEAVANIDKTNEIDINRIKEMLKQRELDHNKDERPIVKRAPSSFKEIEEEKNYDINEILIRAKENKETTPLNRKLNASHLEISRRIEEDKYKAISNDTDEEELKELINTITKTSYIKKMEDKDLSLNLLSDLKGKDNTITTDNESIRKIIEAQKEALEKKEEKKEMVDKSFYTSGISFSKEDFDSLEKDEKEEVSIVVKAVVFLLLVILTAGIILGLIMFLR